jgi:hypothetical protein
MTGKIANSQVDVSGLKQLYVQDERARAVLDHLAARERNYRKLSVDRLLAILSWEGHRISRGEAVRILRSLEALRCGTFRTGRKGHPSRFEWDVAMTEVGKAAAGESDKIEPVKLEEGEEGTSSTIIEHGFRLRPDVNVTIGLPADFSAGEAARLADFVKTLPFGN